MGSSTHDYTALHNHLKSIGHDFYGAELPADFVWDVLPLLYVRLYSNTSWRIITTAARQCNPDTEGALISTIDKQLIVLAKQYPAAHVLASALYADAELSEGYVSNLVGALNPLVSNKDCFLDVFARFMRPINEARTTPRINQKDFAFACDLAHAACRIQTIDTVFCANIGWPEYFETARIHLLCKKLVGWDYEYQNGYFAGIYAHLYGWECSINGASDEEEASDIIQKSKKMRCILGVAPDTNLSEWVRMSSNLLKKDGLMFAIVKPDALPKGLNVSTCLGDLRVLGVFKLERAWVLALRKKKEIGDENEPVFCFDEPSTGVDKITRRTILDARKMAISDFRKFLETMR